jgi:hypothetical protein
VQTNDLPPPVGVRRHGDYGCDRDDAPALADLQVGCIQPEIGPVAVERPLQEGADPLVDLLAELRHLALADAAEPIACTRSSTFRVDTPAIQASWITEISAFSVVFRAPRKSGK